MVYFIQQGDDGPVKIGYSEVDPAGRLRELQTGNPYRLRLLGAVVGTVADERRYHKRFAEHRLEGEWFSPAQEVLDCCVPAADVEEIIDTETKTCYVEESEAVQRRRLLDDPAPPRPSQFSLAVARPQDSVPGKWRTTAPSSEVKVRHVDPGLLRLRAALDKRP